jgi:hypothetical protein
MFLRTTEPIQVDKKAVVTMVRLNSYNKTLCHDLRSRLYTMESCLTLLVRVTPASFDGKMAQRDAVFRRN